MDMDSLSNHGTGDSFCLSGPTEDPCWYSQDSVSAHRANPRSVHRATPAQCLSTNGRPRQKFTDLLKRQTDPILEEVDIWLPSSPGFVAMVAADRIDGEQHVVPRASASQQLRAAA